MRRGIFVPLCLAALLCALLTGCREERQSDHTDLDAKPVLYLYPEKETEVNVRLDYGGELTCTYPACGEEGWTVTAAPDGTLTDRAGQTYSYLYWEGLSDGDYDFSQGFCVPGEDTAAFLESSLEKLGLTRREANEFIVYWLPRMQSNPFNLISFQFEHPAAGQPAAGVHGLAAPDGGGGDPGTGPAFLPAQGLCRGGVGRSGAFGPHPPRRLSRQQPPARL